jgi:hypothetical protein
MLMRSVEFELCAVPSARYVPLYRGFVPQLASSMTASHRWVERGGRPLLMIHSCPVLQSRSSRRQHKKEDAFGNQAAQQASKASVSGWTPPYLVASPIYPSMEHDVPYPKHRFLDGPLLPANPISLSPSVRFVAWQLAWLLDGPCRKHP